MNPFDRMVDALSAQDLKARVRVAILFGLLLVLAGAAAGWALFTQRHEIALDATGRWLATDRPELEVALEKEDLKRLPADGRLSVEILPPGDEPFRSPGRLVEVDASAGRILLDAAGVPDQLKTAGRFRVRLILFEESYGKMLWQWPW